MLPVASHCRKVLKYIPKPSDVTTKTSCSVKQYAVNIDISDSCPPCPLFSYPTLSSSVLAHQLQHNTTKHITSILQRCSHSLVISDSIDLAHTVDERGIGVALLPEEIQYTIRIGEGVAPPVNLFNGTQPQHVRVYLTVFHLKENKELHDISISSYSKTTLQPYRPQQDNGSLSFPDTILNYTFRTREQDNMMCCLSLEHEDGVHLGRCYLSLDHSNALQTRQPGIKLPVINETDAIVGTLDCSIIEVAGLDSPLNITSPTTPPPVPGCSPNISTQPLMCQGEGAERGGTPLHDTKPLEIGHRGCGVTHSDRELFTSLPCLPENTIASLMMAYLHGADMVETDVAVTQDQKAVIHHDLEIQITDQTTLPISHVTSNILENLPLPEIHMTEKEAREQLLTGVPGGERHMRLVAENLSEFPSLRETLRKLPGQLGIMLEVKSSIPEVGKEPVPYHNNKNTYVDTILLDLLEHAGNRYIILCSFCPTTCIMLRNKQTRWPVILIVQGSSNTYRNYTDHRLRSFHTAVNLAISENLHGLSIFSGLLQEDAPAKLGTLRQAGLAAFVWGYHNCEKKFRDEMRSYNVSGIIYDRIYEEELPKRALSPPCPN